MANFQQTFQSSNSGPPWSQTPCPPSQDLPAITQKAIDTYMYSQQPNGSIGGIGWWQCANGYTAIALHDIYARSNHNYHVLASALRKCEGENKNFVNEFNDDSLWWALCCVHTYHLGGEDWFLEKAIAVWRHVVDSGSVCPRGKHTFQGHDMEGAVFWTTKHGEEQINAVSTGLFAELSLRLAMAGGGDKSEESSGSKWKHPIRTFKEGKKPSTEEYVQHARKALNWILRYRYRADEGVVLDNILLKKQAAQDWAFTYNTGVAIGAAALLYQVTGEAEYMASACRMAHTAMRRGEWVEENGVLTERGAYGNGTHDPGEDNDAVGFKAVLMRQLTTLYRVIVGTNCDRPEARECAQLIRTFVQVNFRSQQERNTNGNGQYGPWWNGPFEMPTSHSQMAVLDVMAATVAVS